MTFRMKGFPQHSGVKTKGLGPRATPKKSKDEWTHDTISPGFEDPMKIQKVQKEGLTPHSQEFSNKAFLKSQNESKVERSDLDEKGKKIYDTHRKKKSPAKQKTNPAGTGRLYTLLKNKLKQVYGKKAVKQGVKDSMKKSASKGVSEAAIEGMAGGTGKMARMEKKGEMVMDSKRVVKRGKLVKEGKTRPKRTMTKKMRKKTTREKSTDYDKRMVEKLKKKYKTPVGAK